MLQDFLIILHICNQILNLNLYAIQVTFIGIKIHDIMHFATNSLEILLLIYCIFAWNKCGLKIHSLIVLFQTEKLVIINFFDQKVHLRGHKKSKPMEGYSILL